MPWPNWSVYRECSGQVYVPAPSVAVREREPLALREFERDAEKVGVAVAISDELSPGAVVRINKCTCTVTEPLGVGSFGTVWAGRLEDGIGGEVAIKEIRCRSPAELANAAYEGYILELLHLRQADAASQNKCDQNLTGSDVSGVIPAPVARETDFLGPSSWRVRLAMTRVPGEPLDNFLERCVRGHENSLERRREQFADAVSFAQELISQFAPTFEGIHAISYHRDVNSHNILIDTTGRTPRYGLVDFGLAVDLAEWWGPFGASSWQLVDIGGDCRYWPVSAWLQFEAGCQTLDEYPHLSAEYQTQLDPHALGITALQLFAAMSPPVAAAVLSRGSVDGDDTCNAEELGDAAAILCAMQALQLAWEKYWEDAMLFWRRLLDAFRSGADQNALKASCIDDNCHGIVAEDLRVLRSALREASDACERPAASACLRSARPLFSTLLRLISCGDAVADIGSSGRPRGVDWREIRLLVNDSDGETLNSLKGPTNNGNSEEAITLVH